MAVQNPKIEIGKSKMEETGMAGKPAATISTRTA
jgi:hypothetical protein